MISSATTAKVAPSEVESISAPLSTTNLLVPALDRQLGDAYDTAKANLDAGSPFLLTVRQELKESLTADPAMDDRAFLEAIGKLLTTQRRLGILHIRRMSTTQMVQLVCHCNPRLLSTFSHPCMPSLLSGMVGSDIASAEKTFFTAAPLSSLTPSEAYSIGLSLSVSLGSELIAEGGVELWLAQHQSMRDLLETNRHFRTLAVTIARRKLLQKPWGMLVFRVSLGAFISFADLITDLVTVVRFAREGRHVYAIASICMVGVCVLAQCFMVFLQNKKRGKLRIVQESLYVMTFVKPAVDAYRVCSGEEASQDELLDPFVEMIIMKTIEMLFEAIPAAILQSYAFLGSDMRSLFPLFSISTSILTIAYSSAMVALDQDCNLAKRRAAPHFYGYIPDGACRRFIVFIVMVLFSALHITLKILGVALLAIINPTIVGAMLGGDLLVYLLYKILRNDFFYWLPLEGLAATVGSLICRLFVKLLVDFTAQIHARHPFELGGLYWSCNLILAHVAALVAVYLFSTMSISANPINSSFLWSLVAGLECSFLLFFAIFLCNIKRSYISTFFTTMTGPQFAHYNYDRATTDEVRFDIFYHHASYIVGMRQELSLWLADNWTRWSVDEHPAWFTPRLIATIPEYMLPAKATQETKALRLSTIQEIRRKSILGTPIGAPGEVET